MKHEFCDECGNELTSYEVEENEGICDVCRREKEGIPTYSESRNFAGIEN